MIIFGGHVISESSNDLETPGKIKRRKNEFHSFERRFLYF